MLSIECMITTLHLGDHYLDGQDAATMVCLWPCFLDGLRIQNSHLRSEICIADGDVEPKMEEDIHSD